MKKFMKMMFLLKRFSYSDSTYSNYFRNIFVQILRVFDIFVNFEAQILKGQVLMEPQQVI